MKMNRKDFMQRISNHVRTCRQHLASLSLVQSLYLLTFTVILVAFTTVFVLYHSAIFAFIQSIKSDLLESSWKWLILVGLTGACSVPPLIGYASSVTLAGYVFGFTRGWGIALLGSLVGAGAAFLLYRYLLTNMARRMSAQNVHFAALTRALDGAQGWTLLVMIRLCPFPFSLSNAALATIPSITLPKFMGATLIGGLRLAVHAFVGSRLADFADAPEGDRKSKLVSTLGIVAGILIGLATGYAVYMRTKVIAARLGSDDSLDEEEANREIDANAFSRYDERHGEAEDSLTATRSRESDSLLR